MSGTAAHMVRLYVSVAPGQPPSRKWRARNSSRMAARRAANASALVDPPPSPSLAGASGSPFPAVLRARPEQDRPLLFGQARLPLLADLPQHLVHLLVQRVALRVGEDGRLRPLQPPPHRL